MKAVVSTRYGSPEVLQFTEIATPVPRDHEVLILLAGPGIALATGKKVRVLPALPNRQDIASMAEFCEAGTITLVIDRVYPLKEVPEALRYLGEGHARGKVVIRVA